MHPVQVEWCKSIKEKFQDYFVDKRILDIGSLDINGNNRYLFTNCEYIGLDVVCGKNVDIVCIAHEYHVKDETFDVVMSTNALEHDIYYAKTLNRMIELLKPGGLIFFSVSSYWKEHGTLKVGAQSSGTSKMGQIWSNYYKNLVESDIKEVLDLVNFERYEFSMEKKDTRFWGIKRRLR